MQGRARRYTDNVNAVRRVIPAIILAACSKSAEDVPTQTASPAASPPVADLTAASVAYHARQFGTCARLYGAIADRAGTPKGIRRDAAYDAACCFAQDGKADPAFAQLDHAIALGMRDKQHLESDTDLVSIRGDARWPRLAAAIDQANAEADKAVKEPGLRKELLAMRDADQAVRFAWIADKTAAKLDAMTALDHQDSERMRAIVATYGWPGSSLVGDDAANAAWLLVQHADKDPALQKDALAKMAPLVETEDVSPTDYGYLWDRVAVAEHRPQRYGTQFDTNREPQPIEDEAHVDERRAAIGLPSMAEYRQQMRKLYGAPNQ
jgi:hypothetical protein